MFSKGGETIITITQRIMEVIENLGCSKSEFARKINVSPSYISKLEKETSRSPSERTILDICRMFNVSYIWLTTGKGEMFSDVAESSVEAVAKTYNLNDDDKKILTSFLALTPEERDILKKVMKSFTE